MNPGVIHPGVIHPGVIDLDEVRPPHDTPGAGRRRPIGSVLVGVVLLTAVLTGPVGPPRLTLSWRLPMSTPYVWLTSRYVYTVDQRDLLTLVAHDPGTGQVRWQRSLSGALASAYANRAPIATRFPPRVGSDARTDVGGPPGPQLSYPALAMPLVQITDDLAVLIDRADTDRETGVYRVTAIDLRTGSPRWSRIIPSGSRWSLPGVRPGTTGIAALPDGPPWMVTSTADGELEVWDLETGGTRVRRVVAALGRESYVMALADQILVWRPGADGPTMQLLSPVTLATRSTFVPVLPDAVAVSCAPYLCLAGNGGVVVVDPADGAVLYRLTGADLRPGPDGRLLVSSYGRPLSIVDLITGRVWTLPNWTVEDAGSAGSETIIAGSADGRPELALLDVTTASLVPFSPVDGWTPGSLCQITSTELACTDALTLTVWAR